MSISPTPRSSPWSACAFVDYLCTVPLPSPSGPSPCMELSSIRTTMPYLTACRALESSLGSLPSYSPPSFTSLGEVGTVGPMGMACPLPKSAGSPPLTRFQNRACTFPFTRLLSCAVLVRSTCDRLIFGGLDVMTMSMKKLEVGGCAISPTRGGNDVVAFHHVLPMFEVQSTPGAAAALPLE